MEPASVSADRRASGERLRRLANLAPILAPIVGGAALIAGNLLGTVCTRWLPGENGCAEYGLAPVGEAMSLAGLLGIVLGLYVIFAPSHGRYTHTCASCHRRFQDKDPRGERRVAGQIACSTECADRLGEAGRMEELRAKVEALEDAAKRGGNEVMRDRATERLREIAAEAHEPIRSLARDALKRIGIG